METSCHPMLLLYCGVGGFYFSLALSSNVDFGNPTNMMLEVSDYMDKNFVFHSQLILRLHLGHIGLVKGT